MNIGEVVELTQKMPLSQVARDYLNIGEKPTREALKLAGCTSIKGKRGWIFQGHDKKILEKSIYDFSKVKAKVKIETEKPKVINSDVSNRRRSSFDIDKDLLKKLKIAAVEEERNIYELVEDAIRLYLNK